MIAEKRNILMVCQGNICRSPMAEGIWKKLFPAHVVESAGLSAPEGNPADPLAIIVMREIGLDISFHRSRQIRENLVRWADLLLVMTNAQRNILEEKYPWIREKVFRLGHFEGYDIDDPLGASVQTFRRICRQIESCAQSWIKYF